MNSSSRKPSKAGLEAIYQKIGQEKGLEAILRDFYQALTRDILVGYFFEGKDLEHIITQQKSFLMRAMGATRSYSGQPPARAHENLPPIWMGHFDRRLRILEETLQKHGLSAEDIRIWVDFEETFRNSIVSPDSHS